MITSYPPPLPASPRNSAVKAGWICLICGVLTFWIFGLGFLFFSVAIVLSVIGLCTNQVQNGLILLVSSIFSLAVCVFLFMLLVLGTFGAIGQSMMEAQKAEQERLRKEHEEWGAEVKKSPKEIDRIILTR